MRRSLKVLLVLLLAMQSFAYAGPVCGNHTTTMEAMDCCKKGHVEKTSTAGDTHAEECCGTCDMGKASGLKAQKQDTVLINSLVSILSFEVALSVSHSQPQEWGPQQFQSYSPPLIYLLNDTFLI